MTEPIDLTPEEQQSLNRAFESKTSLFSLLATLRTRRMGLGYRSETGQDETFEWSSGKTVRQSEGPLAYSSAHDAVPLTEVEEALIAWAGLGPNGIVAGRTYCARVQQRSLSRSFDHQRSRRAPVPAI